MDVAALARQPPAKAAGAAAGAARRACRRLPAAAVDGGKRVPGTGADQDAAPAPAARRQRRRAQRAADQACSSVAAPEAGVASAVGGLPTHPKLRRGVLDNGLHYVILPNAVPPRRFEAHLEVHAGSIDEEVDEQGLAHLVEHVTFLGSKKREGLLGTGSRSNAYTDFHHTVFHIHSPLEGPLGQPMVRLALEALEEIAFQPRFLPQRIEKERRAVLAELQMMNTIEYRVDCQLLEQLHSENRLGNRFPIGKQEQIVGWDHDTVRRYHAKHYFPANTTLYVVGDVDADECAALVEEAFGDTPARPHKVLSEDVEVPEKPRRQAAPPVVHLWSSGGAGVGPTGVPEAGSSGVPVAPPRPPSTQPVLFQHTLLESVQLSVFAKVPVESVTNVDALVNSLMVRIVLSAFQFRVSALYNSYLDRPPPFSVVELDHSDSGREGCAVTTFSVTAEPEHWDEAVRVAALEVRRLVANGLSEGEMKRFLSALLADSEQLALQMDRVPSVDNLDFIMESDALGHCVMDQMQGNDALVVAAQSVTLDEVNRTARELCRFVSEFGRDGAPQSAAIVMSCPEAMSRPGPDGAPVPFVVSPEDVNDALQAPEGIETFASAEVDVPDMLMTRGDVAVALQRHAASTVASVVPQRVADPKTGAVQIKLRNGISVNYKHTLNEPCNAMLRVVAPGGRSMEDVKSGGAVAVGTRTLSEGGCVADYSREQIELFCVSNLINCMLESDEEFVTMDFHFSMREEGLAKSLQLLHLVLTRPRWEGSAFERAKQLYASHWRASTRSLERAASNTLIQTLLGEDRRFTDPAPEELDALVLERVRDIVQGQLATETLEVNIVGDFDVEVLEDMLDEYVETVPPSALPSAVVAARNASGLSYASDAGIGAKRMQRLHLTDSDERACAYLAGRAPNRWGAGADPAALQAAAGGDASGEAQQTAGAGGGVEVPAQQMSASQMGNVLAAAAAAAGAATGAQPAAGGAAGVTAPTPPKPSLLRQHPMFAGVALSLLAEVMNSRLFTTVRDSLGLTYDVSFELSNFERLVGGWYLLSVTSMPEKIDEAAAASLRVLRGLALHRVTTRELDRARRTLLTRHESDLKDNQYWLGLLSHTQSESVPGKNLGCVSDLVALYESATVDDLYEAYRMLDTGDGMVTCIATSGTEERPVVQGYLSAALAGTVGQVSS